ncbi:MAG: fluoride efflux transporter CrcB [Firmicutes bacterium]|nr:fluoride efflux transporter CrcB [Bacillota bacterium]
MNYFWVGIGGIFGALSRYAVSLIIAPTGMIPYHTLTANFLGCYVLGLLVFLNRWRSSNLRLAVTIGFMGSFTTFSTFSLETANLIKQGYYIPASFYAIGSAAGGVLLAALGMLTARLIDDQKSTTEVGK